MVWAALNINSAGRLCRAGEVARFSIPPDRNLPYLLTYAVAHRDNALRMLLSGGASVAARGIAFAQAVSKSGRKGIERAVMRGTASGILAGGLGARTRKASLYGKKDIAYPTGARGAHAGSMS